MTIVAKLTHIIEINNLKILDSRLVVVYNSADIAWFKRDFFSSVNYTIHLS